MREAELLDRKLYRCKVCKRSWSLREVIITRAFFTARQTIVIRMVCPQCKKKMHDYSTNNRKQKEILEEYLTSLGLL